ncbi:hypothetical protein Q9L42_016450 [Methylomarinum sp. Ch1-1]|uniref:Coiled coil domain-containing protein n=1 Tax=Methylomarinum roseum TaxID=3067653 RepID=A0AAU7NSF3_9GAMM|nr:hypothetical protein [Methylomarinum sp. Ch1-1]MDP4520073.1 hypothetical protein [Methylomarinum sp. Ch1-1]
MSNRSDYVKKMKAKLDEWNADIDRLEARAEAAQADLQIEYQQQIEALKEERDEAAAKLKTLEAASDEAWEDIKSGVEMAWTSLHSAVDSAISRFK